MNIKALVGLVTAVTGLVGGLVFQNHQIKTAEKQIEDLKKEREDFSERIKETNEKIYNSFAYNPKKMAEFFNR